MTPTDIGNLTGILASVAQIGQTAYTEAAYIAQKTIEYTNELTSKQISKPEFDDLMADLNVDQLVARDAEQMEIKEALQAYTKELLSIASAIAVF